MDTYIEKALINILLLLMFCCNTGVRELDSFLFRFRKGTTDIATTFPDCNESLILYFDHRRHTLTFKILT